MIFVTVKKRALKIAFSSSNYIFQQVLSFPYHFSLSCCNKEKSKKKKKNAWNEVLFPQSLLVTAFILSEVRVAYCKFCSEFFFFFFEMRCSLCTSTPFILSSFPQFVMLSTSGCKLVACCGLNTLVLVKKQRFYVLSAALLILFFYSPNFISSKIFGGLRYGAAVSV